MVLTNLGLTQRRNGLLDDSLPSAAATAFERSIATAGDIRSAA